MNLLQAERLAASCAHQVVCNSHSLKNKCIELGVAKSDKLLVLGSGSSNGVNTTRFQPLTQENEDAVRTLRKRLNISSNSQVIGFVGRLTNDKGIIDLVKAFDVIREKANNVKLLLVGPLEKDDGLSEPIITRLCEDERITLVGYVNDSALYYLLMDIFVFPSHREGFPNAPLEAAASAIPVVGYRVTGTVDAVCESETGYLVPENDWESLAANLLYLLQNSERRFAMGDKGRKWVQSNFDSRLVWQNWIRFYQSLLDNVV